MAIRKIEFIGQNFDRHLLSKLIVPSRIHSYSLCVEYMKQWFLNNMPPNYFKDESIFIDGRHIYDDFNKFSRTEIIKRQKPNLTITPQLEFAYDRERLDFNNCGLTNYIKRYGTEEAFFKDFENNTRLVAIFDAIKMNFNFKVRVSSRAQQVDLYNYMKLAFRVGLTTGSHSSMDIHVPFYLIMQIAEHAGFCVDIDNRKIKNMPEFLKYLNRKSYLPFTYKFRYINGKEEFFIRIPETYIHIRMNDLSADDGERDGQIYTNFVIEFNTEVIFPATQAFVYYSEKEQTVIKLGEKIDNLEDIYAIYTIKLLDIPDINNKGWNRYITTEIVEDVANVPLDIDFTPLFDETNIADVIRYTTSINISPETFIDIKIYNGNEIMKTTMDWNTFRLTSEDLLTKVVSNAVIYVDMNYVNNSLLVLQKNKDNRIN